MTSNIKVAVRVRPVQKDETQRGIHRSQTFAIQD